ncbi:MAG: N-acetylmuramoyl-L-alanine amidase [Limisphaerales bacterium]
MSGVASQKGRRVGTPPRWASLIAWLVLAAISGTACRTPPGAERARLGDEIVVCGRMFRIGTPVVLWTDPGGYDAYRVERRFSPWSEADWETTSAASRNLDTPNRYGLRKDRLTETEIEQVRGGGWDLPLLQRVVDQFVLHYDATGTSRRCFEVLHDHRGLSVHFMLDVDGTLYQTLDLKERAWHATTSNSRSIGIEIAQPGAVPTNALSRWEEWYAVDERGPYLKMPPAMAGLDPGFRTPGFVGRPAKPERVIGEIQGRTLVQYDFTPEQYRTLAKLTAALCRIFPEMRCDFPRDADGRLVREKLADDVLRDYRGLLGHYHIQKDKVDPGPAFDWDRLLRDTRWYRLGGWDRE